MSLDKWIEASRKLGALKERRFESDSHELSVLIKATEEEQKSFEPAGLDEVALYDLQGLNSVEDQIGSFQERLKQEDLSQEDRSAIEDGLKSLLKNEESCIDQVLERTPGAKAYTHARRAMNRISPEIEKLPGWSGFSIGGPLPWPEGMRFSVYFRDEASRAAAYTNGLQKEYEGIRTETTVCNFVTAARE